MKMIWAACTLAFFAFLWAGEMTVPNNQSFDQSSHADVAVDDASNPAVLQIKIKQSKTDPFRREVQLYVGRTGSNLCAVVAMLDYLSVRGMSPGPLFWFKDGRVLSRKLFVEMAYARQESTRTSTVATAFVFGQPLQWRRKVLRTL